MRTPFSIAIITAIISTSSTAQERLQILRTEDGRVTSVEGKIASEDCDLMPGESCKLSSAEKALEQLWDLHSVPSEQRSRTVITKQLAVTKKLSIFKFAQVTDDDIALHEGGITIVVDEQGNSILALGRLLPLANDDYLVNEGLEVVSGGAELVTVSENGIRKLKSLDGETTFEQRVDLNRDEVIWIKRDDHYEQIFSKYGETLFAAPRLDEDNRNATIPRRSFPSASDLQTFTISGGATSVGSDYNIFTGQCTFQSRYDASGTREILRTTDLEYSDAAFTGTCTSPTVSSSTNFGVSDTREWDVLWWVKKMTSFADNVIYPNVSGATESNIRVRINGESGPHCASTTARACYSYSNKRMTITGGASNSNPENYNLRTLGHEYGHHIHGTYGLTSSGCSTTNHRTLIKQFIADAYGHILAVDVSTAFNATYFVVLDNVNRHTTGNGTQATSSCSQNFRALNEPIWEVIWDVNCSVAGNCVSSSSVNAANSIGQYTYRLRDTIAQGLAFAALLEPPSGSAFTIQDVFTSIESYSASELGPTSGSAIGAIFAHHGL